MLAFGLIDIYFWIWGLNYPGQTTSLEIQAKCDGRLPQRRVEGRELFV